MPAVFRDKGSVFGDINGVPLPHGFDRRTEYGEARALVDHIGGIVLLTGQYSFLGGHQVHGNAYLSFITYDDEHHRIALIGTPE